MRMICLRVLDHKMKKDTSIIRRLNLIKSFLNYVKNFDDDELDRESSEVEGILFFSFSQCRSLFSSWRQNWPLSPGGAFVRMFHPSGFFLRKWLFLKWRKLVGNPNSFLSVNDQHSPANYEEKAEKTRIIVSTVLIPPKNAYR